MISKIDYSVFVIIVGMKYNQLLLLFILVSFGINAQTLKQISLEDIWVKGTYAPKFVSGFQSLNDGRFYCATDTKQNLLRYNLATGKLVDTLISQLEIEQLNNGNALDLADVTFSADEQKVLIGTQVEPIYRHSSKGVYYVYDIKAKKLVLPTKNQILYPDFSPNGNLLAYVKDNNLFVYDLIRQTETQLTTDGKPNQIINGGTDWVYEEEFAIWKGFAWNALGNKIAFYRFDESKVKEYSMPMYGKLYPENTVFKYPKAGESNSMVQVFVADVLTGLLSEMEVGKETDQYLPRIQWVNSLNKLAIQRLNRLQNKLEVLLAEPENGRSSVIYTETNARYIDIPEQLTFIDNGKSFLITSEKSGYNHLYQFNLKGKLIKQITSGNWDLTDFYGYNEQTKQVFYASAQEGAENRAIYAQSLNGKTKLKLAPEIGWNSAAFNKDFTFFLHTYSTINTAPVYAIRDSKGAFVRNIETNQGLQNALKNAQISKASFQTFTTKTGQHLNGFTILPVEFDSSKKYPLLMYVYGGPGSQTVMNRWFGANYLWFQHLAQKGFILVSVDGRGTGFKGEEFKKCTYLNLGKYEIQDQIEVAEKLARLPYVDTTRIAIWGWSFGGYMSSLGISKGGHVFKKAIAVAPVTNWRFYDNIYTERFMRTPQENGANYDDNSPINHVEKITGKYLLIHGTADDNVHFQNTVELIDQMIRNGIRFDSEMYPNKNHGIGGSKYRLHLYKRMTDFLESN